MSAFSADWYVPADGSLQEVITGAASGDTVWVASGNYVTNITVGAGITVRSVSGLPADVILDGNANGRVVDMGTDVGGNLQNNWVISITIRNGLITGEASHGGGIYAGYASNCVVANNSVEGYGGGSHRTWFYNSIISNNSAISDGGGLDMGNCYNCLIVGNSGGSGGGAINANLFNCTVVNNSSTGNGGGIWGGNVYNCISWNNNKTDYNINYSYSCGVGYNNAGSITNNPLFVSSSDCHLQAGSPCRDIGNNTAWDLENTKDVDGNWRVRNDVVDMGAYEYQYGSTNFPPPPPPPLLIISGTGISSIKGTGTGNIKGKILQ